MKPLRIPTSARPSRVDAFTAGGSGASRARRGRCGGPLRPRRAAALDAAVGAAHRLPSAARLGVARRNSLRSLRELRSNNRRESEVRSALRAPTPRLRCSAPQTSPPRAGAAAARRNAPDAPGSPRCRLPHEQRRGCSRPGRDPSLQVPQGWLQGRGQRGRPERGRPVGPLGAGAPVRSREAQSCRPAREARFVPLTRRDCPSAVREAHGASFAAGPARRASQGTAAQRGQAPARRRPAARPAGRAPGGPVVRALARAGIPRTASRKPRVARVETPA